jgi:hypothetical protein
MGRPLKDGLDYFPLDTKNDDKLDLMEAKYGIVGYAVIIKLWSHIYKEFGYYYPWGEREQLLFSHRINVDINRVNAIIEHAIKIGIFDKSKASMGVLTSRGIQKRYIEATKRRHEISFYTNLLLVNVNIIPVNVSNKPRSLLFNVYAGTHIEIENEIEIESMYTAEINAHINSSLEPEEAHAPIPEPEPEEEQQEPGAYPKAIYAEWEALGSHVYQPSSLWAFSQKWAQQVRPYLKGIHSKDVIQALANLKAIYDAPAGTYYWTQKIGVEAFFSKHLEKFLPANFNTKDFEKRLNFREQEEAETRAAYKKVFGEEMAI